MQRSYKSRNGFCISNTPFRPLTISKLKRNRIRRPDYPLPAQKFSVIHQTRLSSQSYNPIIFIESRKTPPYAVLSVLPPLSIQKDIPDKLTPPFFRPTADCLPSISSCTKGACSAKQFAQYVFSCWIQKWLFSGIVIQLLVKSKKICWLAMSEHAILMTPKAHWVLTHTKDKKGE